MRLVKTTIILASTFALFIGTVNFTKASTPTFNVVDVGVGNYNYSTEDDVTIYSTFDINNLDSSRVIVISNQGQINGQNGWISFSPQSVTLQPGEKETVNFSINIPAGVCSGIYRGPIISKLLSYSDGGSGSGLSISTAVGKKVTINVTNSNNSSCTNPNDIPALNVAPAYESPAGGVSLSVTEPTIVPGPTHPDQTPYTPSSGGSGGGGGGGSPAKKPSKPSTAPGSNTPVTSSTTTPPAATPNPKLIVYDICKEHYTSPFTDIRGHYAEGAINFLYNNYTIDGYKDGTFKPDQNINRAELTKMTLLTFAYNITSLVTSAPFKDVPIKQWYAPYISSAKVLGIISGYKDGYFRPTQNVTRAEALKIILFAAGRSIPQAKGSIFSDIAVKDWFYDLVNYGYEKGIIKGLGKDKFAPNSPITRGQAAIILANSVCSVDTPLLKAMKIPPHREDKVGLK